MPETNAAPTGGPPQPRPTHLVPAPLAVVAKHPFYMWAIVGTAGFGSFLGSLNTSMNQLVIPDLERYFDTTVDIVSWVSMAYLIAMAVMLPIAGRLSDIYGRKLMYLLGFVVFTAGSIFCALAPTVELLIASRLLQGLGAASLSANSMAIIVSAVSLAFRGRALGIQIASQSIGLCVGATLGGLLIAEFHWRSAFWLNVPLGLVGLAAAWLVLPLPQTSPKHEPFDYASAGLLVSGVAALMFAINQVGPRGLGSPTVWAVAVAGVSLLVLMARLSRKKPFPLIDVQLLKNRSFVMDNVADFISSAILFSILFLMPFLFERVFHQSVAIAGLSLSVIFISQGILAAFSGSLADRIGTRPLCVAGMTTVFACLLAIFLLLRLPDPSAVHITIALAALGVGRGMFSAPNNSLMMAKSLPTTTGATSGVVGLLRSLGSTFGVAMTSALLASQLRTGDAVASTLTVNSSALITTIGNITACLAGLALAGAIAAVVAGTGTRHLTVAETP